MLNAVKSAILRVYSATRLVDWSLNDNQPPTPLLFQRVKPSSAMQKLRGTQDLMGLKSGKSYSVTGPHTPHLLRRATDQDRRAFRWLSPTFFDIEEAYESTLGLLHPSTCEWVESIDKFQSWFLSDSAAILGIFGQPGCGVCHRRFFPNLMRLVPPPNWLVTGLADFLSKKSVLAAKIIRSLKGSPQVEGNRPPAWRCDLSMDGPYRRQLGPHYWKDLYDVPEPLAYVFCDALPIEERTSAVVLSVLLAQLCRQNSELLSTITMKMEQLQSASASVQDLTTMFSVDVARIIRRYYLILDGLDRVGDCVKVLLDLVGQNNCPKILVFSRSPAENLSDLMEHPTFEITREHIEHDIKLILQSEIKDAVSALGSHTRQNLEETFLAGHQGSFLWGRVLRKYLESQQESSSIPAAWFKVPRSLPIPNNIHELYTLAFDSIAQDPDPFKRDIAVRSLAWVAVAQRPLDLWELQIALSITDNQTEFRFDDRLAFLMDLLSEIWGPLLDISQSSFHGCASSVFSNTVTLIHPTLEDFLFSTISPTAKNLGLPLNRTLLHSHAAKVCFTYLSLPEVGQLACGFQRGRLHTVHYTAVQGFLSYAAVYLSTHMSFSGETAWPDSDVYGRASRLTKSWETDDPLPANYNPSLKIVADDAGKSALG
jgi:hypothetical protein